MGLLTALSVCSGVVVAGLLLATLPIDDDGLGPAVAAVGFAVAVSLILLA